MGEAIMESRHPVLRLHKKDNVVVALRDLSRGEFIEEERVQVMEAIPKGHKVATTFIPEGTRILKYGHTIGIAKKDIPAGSWVHTHNLAVAPRRRRYAKAKALEKEDLPEVTPRAKFLGIPRSNGRIGTRNYIGIISTVNCSATVARRIADAFQGMRYPGVDGVVALVHGEGCAGKGSGERFEAFRRVFTGYMNHPNFAGVLLVGLGCEVNQPENILMAARGENGPIVRSLVIQDQGGTQRTIEKGVEIVREMLKVAQGAKREEISAEKIVLGVECGGSDAYSGITANPALGFAADMLVSHGGTVILSETPEIYGAEHLLMERASSPQIAQKLLKRIRWWESYVRNNEGEMDNNPSPGNKRGGLTTILEKSLGAVSKGGTTTLMEVYEYAEEVRSRGLVFMDTPGYDPASVTGMVAGGANVIAFTTGRGSAFGCKPVPVVKLATTSELFHAMEDDMDIDCGTIIRGEESVAEVGARIFQKILDVASGERTKSELLGYGDMEFVPWRMGAMM
jgi:altronate hydrolase